MPNMKKVVLLIKPEGVYDRRLLRGIAKYAHSKDNWTVFHEIEQEKRALHFVKNWGANGIIADFREAQRIQRVFPEIPIITIGANQRNSHIPNVASDSDAISEIAFEHFKERGFTHFAFSGYEDLRWSMERKTSFGSLVIGTNFTFDCFLSKFIKSRRSWQDELGALQRWIVSLPKPIAVFTCNDEYGRHLIEACKIANLSLPEEVAIVGVDDDDIICNLCTPTLSSIFINSESAGYKTAKLLDKLMDGEKMVGQSIVAQPTETTIRGSSDIFLIDDPEINRIIKFIHNNSQRPLDIEEIAEYAGKSRRSLYNSFIKTTGLSPSQYIRNNRIKQISKLLLNTDFSLEQIAKQLGFPGSDKVSRFFRKEKGTTPSEYRRKFGVFR